MAATKLDYTKPVTTNLCHEVHIYHVYKDYMNGAWYAEGLDRWVPGQWTLSGYFLPSSSESRASNLDLVNNESV